MDRFELQPFVVDIFDLDQRIAGGMIHADLRLDLFPDGFGRGERVIAVAHGKEQHRLIFANAIFRGKGFGLGQPAQRLNDLVFKLLALTA